MEKLIRVTKIFSFEMAHMLYNHNGDCKNIHGHSYKLYVTIIGNILDEENNPKNGMVLDFSDIKKLINDNLIENLDHSIMINKNSPHKKTGDFLKEKNFKVIEKDYQTTCENMVYDFSDIIRNILPKEKKLYSLKLYETEKSYAEWYQDDYK